MKDKVTTVRVMSVGIQGEIVPLEKFPWKGQIWGGHWEIERFWIGIEKQKYNTYKNIHIR